ncbi:MAG: hypothetical protein ACRCVV_03745, partial [Shewanella sp.]
NRNNTHASNEMVYTEKIIVIVITVYGTFISYGVNLPFRNAFPCHTDQHQKDAQNKPEIQTKIFLLNPMQCQS